ncbi:hypothetical protein QCA50_020396 [Cerrena zonata]|uniref:Uncharacterized protein n=1 Tax=Cerrena zonata TaxID=2478898 RepID=A0AAW0FCB9_9APHY
MATYYSSFFSSGLLASANDPFAHPQTPEANTPRSNTTPLPDETTPTAPSTTTSYTLPSLPESNSNAQVSAPVLRRRRSSITLGASPVTSIKARGSAVSTAQKHHSLLNNASSQGSLRSRARAGSLHESMFSRVSVAAPGDAAETKGLVGRLRSGSIGTALRPRRHMRKPTMPAPPPPTAPLPALPPLPPSLTLTIPNANEHTSLTAPSTPRRTMTRSITSDNFFIPIDTPPMSRTLTPHSGAEDIHMSSPRIALPAGVAPGFDYPSPIETPGEKNIAGYF